jgi:hypothetical protein
VRSEIPKRSTIYKYDYINCTCKKGDTPPPVVHLFLGEGVAHGDRHNGAQEVANAAKDGDEADVEAYLCVCVCICVCGWVC